MDDGHKRNDRTPWEIYLGGFNIAWVGQYDASSFRREFGFEFQGDGWYENDTDTLLAQCNEKVIDVAVWNQTGERDRFLQRLVEFMSLASLSVRKVESPPRRLR